MATTATHAQAYTQEYTMTAKRKRAPDCDQRKLKISGGYVHGTLSKREFISQAGKCAATKAERLVGRDRMASVSTFLFAFFLPPALARAAVPAVIGARNGAAAPPEPQSDCQPALDHLSLAQRHPWALVTAATVWKKPNARRKQPA